MDLAPPQPGDSRFLPDGSRIIADWHCPVCGTHTPRTTRPGRPRVYCTNSCRQRAYRFRRARNIRLRRGDGQPTERGRGADVRHILRPPSDPLHDRRTSRRQKVSLCGAFVQPAHDHPDLRTAFVVDEPDACYRCLLLTGTPRPDPPMIHPWQHSRKSYAGPPLESVPAPPEMATRLRGRGPRRVSRRGGRCGRAPACPR
jgi:predicted nucleic acid-binding Zn ribbon protein